MASTVSESVLCDPTVEKTNTEMAGTLIAEAHEKPAEILSRQIQNSQEQWASLAASNKLLELLDMPDDILQAILREITHTNDLTALALTHSTLHELVVPHIYSRFDIVWPEANTHIESRIGVDALTYGLATLVMAPDVFGETICSTHGTATQTSLSPRKVRRGNYFARYTKKFSLGNGPADWVQEYLITKEGGKMLGTLVALAVGRMRNLETFIWDMPTGVLRDVWLALASLGNRDDGQDCRLEKVWVRWHDNTDAIQLHSPSLHNLPPQQPPNIPTLPIGSVPPSFQIPAYPRVEFPTFSILPPLKSLSVLDMDELPYAEELSVLIERSLSTLCELRVGLGQHAQYYGWARPSEDRSGLPPAVTTNILTTSRPGGLLGIIFGRFCESPKLQSKVENAAEYSTAEMSETPSKEESTTSLEFGDLKVETTEQSEDALDVPQISRLLADSTLEEDTAPEATPLAVTKRGQKKPTNVPDTGHVPVFDALADHNKARTRLQLEVLELERIHLSIQSISRAIDWSRLIQLTILGCQNHDLLWKELRKKFTPVSKLRSSSAASRSISTSLSNMFSTSRNGTPVSVSVLAEDYPLKLRRLHTDCVSPALIAFIKDSLAPDTLEWLFLQECITSKSTVNIDTLYRGAIRRHRGSLKKLLIDSEVRKGDESIPGSWKRWIYSRELLTAITSGKMKLRELSMSIDYKDWHYFLQRLPTATQIRSLHITHMSEHVHGNVDSKEAALQVLDIVSLKPEMELCYLGVQRQCFEVLEIGTGRRVTSLHDDNISVIQATDDSEDNDDSADEHGQDEDSDFEVDTDDGQTDDEGQDPAAKPAFRLREILFYDDKVSIFKARHGRL